MPASSSRPNCRRPAWRTSGWSLTPGTRKLIWTPRRAAWTSVSIICSSSSTYGLVILIERRAEDRARRKVVYMA